MAAILLFILPALALLGLAGLIFYLGLRSTRRKPEPEIEWREPELLEAEVEGVLGLEQWHPMTGEDRTAGTKGKCGK